MGKEPTTGKVRAEDAGKSPAAGTGEPQTPTPTPPIGCIVTAYGTAAIVIGYEPAGAIVEDAAGRRITASQGLDMPTPGTALYRAAQILTRDRSWLPDGAAIPPAEPYPSMQEVFDEIRAAGGDAWDDVADPDAEILEMRGGPEEPDDTSGPGGPLSSRRLDERLEEHTWEQWQRGEGTIELTAAGAVAITVAGTVWETIGTNPDAREGGEV